MPKIGMEPLRRRALAHHYFGAKDDLLFATMRHLLSELRGEAVAALATAATPRQRLDAVVAVSFSPAQFSAEIVGAWLAFYVAAQHAAPMRRLLAIYARRLHSNLMAGLAPLLPRAEAIEAAEATAALIDGLYIRRALKNGEPDPVSAVALVRGYLDLRLGGRQ